MTKQDIIGLFGAICAAYPREQAFAIKDDVRGNTMIEEWHKALGDLPVEVVRMAFDKHKFKSQWPPSIAELRGAATEILHPETGMTEIEALGYAEKMIKRFNPYAPDACAKGIPPDVVKIVRRMGIADLAMTPMSEMGVFRGQFRALWKNANDRKREEAALPAGLKEQMAALGAKMEMKMIGGAK